MVGVLVLDQTRREDDARPDPAQERGQLERMGRLGLEPAGAVPVVVDLSAPEDLALWTSAMAAHASQLGTRNYVELQLARARVLGLRSGGEYAQALYPADPLVFDSLAPLGRAARRF